MPKVKKHPTLPNGFGSIRHLSGRRSNQYAVHPPAKRRNEKGNYIQEKPLCYVPDWYTGFAVLTAYHAGTYVPGMEYDIKTQRDKTSIDLDSFCRTVLNNVGMIRNGEVAGFQRSFKNVADEWFESRHGENATKKRSDSMMKNDTIQIKNLEPLHDRPIKSITLDELQYFVNTYRINNGELPTDGTIRHLVRVIKGVFSHADKREYIEKNVAQYVEIPDREKAEPANPFWDEELKILWENSDNDIVKTLLIMCYSGMRITEYLTIKVNTTDWYFYGGIKTPAGKNRFVPIHSAVQQFVLDLLEEKGAIIECSDVEFRRRMKETLESLHMDTDKSPHSTRHTFQRLCEGAGVSEFDVKRLMGHSLANDVTKGTYGHRTLSELRASIEMIKVDFVPSNVPSCS